MLGNLDRGLAPHLKIHAPSIKTVLVYFPVEVLRLFQHLLLFNKHLGSQYNFREMPTPVLGVDQRAPCVMEIAEHIYARPGSVREVGKHVAAT